jgi:hypothetical protein
LRRCISLLAAIFALLPASCGDEDPAGPDYPSGDSVLEISLDLTEAGDHGVAIDSIRLLLSGLGYDMDTLLVSPGASPVLSFSGLEEGQHALIAALYSGGSILAEGSISGFVGQADTVPVVIDLEYVEASGEWMLGARWGEWEPPRRLLFVGNSYTFANGGLERVVAGLAASAHPGDPVYASEITFGGYTLEDHWNTQATRDSIAGGDWDMVVLQEQSTRPVEAPGLMMQYAILLDSLIAETGAGTCLFMTWAREYDPAMIDGLSYAYGWVGHELGATVSPAGLAWERCIADYPGIDLYESDGSHPTQAGTYLTACVFYAVLWGESPEGIEYLSDPSITEEQKLAMQQVAWEAVEDYDTTP